MIRKSAGSMVLVIACVQACSGGEPQSNQPTAQTRAGAITGPPAISGPIALDTGTPDWDWQSGVSLSRVTSVPDEHLLAYFVSSPWGGLGVNIGVPIRDGEAGTPFPISTSPPIPLPPLPCPRADFAWGIDLGLVTDSCGNGVMFDAAGLPVGDPFVITNVPEYYNDYCYYYYGYDCDVQLNGGNVAFDGEYFLTAYGWLSPGHEAAATAYSFAADGTFTDAASIGAPTFYDEEPDRPFGLVSNGTSFLQLVEVGRSSYMYRSNLAVVLSVTDGSITIDDSAYVGVGQSCDSFAPSDWGVYALPLADDYALIRTDSEGEDTGVMFSALDPYGCYYYGEVLDELPSFRATSSADEILLASGLRWIRYDSDFVQLDEEPQTSPVRRPLHIDPAVAHTPAGYFAGWLEYAGDRARSLGRRVTELGAIVEDEPLALRTAASGADKLLFASKGTETLTVHANDVGTQIDVVDDSGSVTPVTTPLATAPTLAGSFSATSDAEGFLLAWQASTGYQALQIDSGGTAGTPFAIGPVAVDSSATASAYDGENSVVVWTAEASTTTRTLNGVRVDATGSVLDTPPVSILTYPSDPPATLGSKVGPALARTSEGLVVVWTEHSGTDAVFQAQRLAADLTLVGDAVEIAEVEQQNPAHPSSAVAAAWDGESLWVVWSAATETPFATLRGRRFTAELEAVDEESFVIDDDAYMNSPVALSSGPMGQLLVAYGNPVTTTLELQIEGRLLSSTGFADGTPCSDDSACASGACEAGVCGPEGSGTGGSAGAAGAPTDGSGGVTTTDGSGGVTATDGSGGVTATDGSGGVTTTEGSGGVTTTDGSGGVTTTDGSGGSGPGSGGSAGSIGGEMGASSGATAVGGAAGDGGVGGEAGTAGEAGAPSGGTHAGSSGNGGSGALGGTEGGTPLVTTASGGSGGTSVGGGGGADCSCSVPGSASHSHLAWSLLFGAVLVGRRRHGTTPSLPRQRRHRQHTGPPSA